MTPAYDANRSGDTVSVIDTATNAVIATIAGVGPGPSGVAIIPGAASAVTVTAEPDPARIDQPVTLTAAVSCSEGTPTGTVVFRDGATVLGSG